jgi:hypothetical protein
MDMLSRMACGGGSQAGQGVSRPVLPQDDWMTFIFHFLERKLLLIMFRNNSIHLKPAQPTEQMPFIYISNAGNASGGEAAKFRNRLNDQGSASS